MKHSDSINEYSLTKDRSVLVYYPMSIVYRLCVSGFGISMLAGWWYMILMHIAHTPKEIAVGWLCLLLGIFMTTFGLMPSSVTIDTNDKTVKTDMGWIKPLYWSGIENFSTYQGIVAIREELSHGVVMYKASLLRKEPVKLMGGLSSDVQLTSSTFFKTQAEKSAKQIAQETGLPLLTVQKPAK